RFRHQRIDAYPAATALLAPERKDLIDQLARAFAGMANLIEVAYAGASGAGLRIGHFRVANDGADDVVEIVRDAAGKRTNRLHPSGLLQIRFQPFLFPFERHPSHGIVYDVERHPKNPDFAMLGQRTRAKRVKSQDRARSVLVATCDAEPTAKSDLS